MSGDQCCREVFPNQLRGWPVTGLAEAGPERWTHGNDEFIKNIVIDLKLTGF